MLESVCAWFRVVWFDEIRIYHYRFFCGGPIEKNGVLECGLVDQIHEMKSLF